jgi:ABC-type amino acid transport system permease subunit
MTNILSDDFWTRLVLGLFINFQIAFSALIIGCIVGASLAFISRRNIPFLTTTIALLMSIFKATPVFIAIFFLAGIMRPYYRSFEVYFYDPKVVFVIIAALPYVISYAYDQFTDALKKWSDGMRRTALLLVPNMARSFQILVSTSCFGAAIGVNEAMSVILSEAELMNESPWIFGLYLGAIVIFFGLMQTVVGTSRWLHRIVTTNLSDTPTA